MFKHPRTLTRDTMAYADVRLSIPYAVCFQFLPPCLFMCAVLAHILIVLPLQLEVPLQSRVYHAFQQ